MFCPRRLSKICWARFQTWVSHVPSIAIAKRTTLASQPSPLRIHTTNTCVCVYIYIYIYTYTHVCVYIYIERERDREREREGERNPKVRDRKMALNWGAHPPRPRLLLELVLEVLRCSPSAQLRGRISWAIFRQGGWYSWKPSSSSNVSIRAFRAYPTFEIRQTAPIEQFEATVSSPPPNLPASYKGPPAVPVPPGLGPCAREELRCGRNWRLPVGKVTIP